MTWAISVPIFLPRPLCSPLRPDVRDRQTSDAHHSLMFPYPRGGGIIRNDDNDDDDGDDGRRMVVTRLGVERR